MLSQNNLETTIYKGMGMSSPSSFVGPLFGCEVELEGNLPAESIPPYWKVKGEDSLRMGYEYIFKAPLKMSDTEAALKSFDEKMAKYNPVGSIRCSTHIHVNVIDLTVRQVYTIACLFHLLEALLFDKVPQTRHGNLFCLSMADAEKIFYDLRESLVTGGYFKFPANQHKYSALNLATVWGLGTVEFRFLHAMWKYDDLIVWFKVFDSIRRFGAENSLTDILNAYEELPVIQFLKKVFQPDAFSFLVEGKTPLTLNQMLHSNYDYIYELERTFERKRYRAAKKHWNPDVGGPEELSQHEAWAEMVTATAAGHHPEDMPLYPEPEMPDFPDDPNQW